MKFLRAGQDHRAYTLIGCWKARPSLTPRHVDSTVPKATMFDYGNSNRITELRERLEDLEETIRDHDEYIGYIFHRDKCKSLAMHVKVLEMLLLLIHGLLFLYLTRSWIYRGCRFAKPYIPPICRGVSAICRRLIAFSFRA
jgi:hypothetical protein